MTTSLQIIRPTAPRIKRIKTPKVSFGGGGGGGVEWEESLHTGCWQLFESQNLSTSEMAVC